MCTIKRLLFVGLVLTALVAAVPTSRATEVEIKEQAQVPASSNVQEELDDLDSYSEYEGEDESEIDSLKPIYSPVGPNPTPSLDYKSPGQDYSQPPLYGQPQVYSSSGSQPLVHPPVNYGPPVQVPSAPAPILTTNYSAPSYSTSSYGASQQSNGYTSYGSNQINKPSNQQTYAPPQQTYAPPQQTYAPPQQTYAPLQQTYGQNQPTTYVLPQIQVPAQTSYVQPAKQSYVLSPPAQVQSQPTQKYSQPVQVKNQASYTTNNSLITYVQPIHPTVANYTHKPQSYNLSYQQTTYVNKVYSPVDLISSVSPKGYLSNHWNIHYYRNTPYRSCPKNIYLSQPNQRDIEAAFSFAKQQLAGAQGLAIQYINGTQLSASARHQVFSFISQQTGRMDEEGLLVELVSSYLADRACLTKWDKQRYLPQLSKLVSTQYFPGTHSCNNYYNQRQQLGGSLKNCAQSKYRSIDGFCNNPYHPYWGKAHVCHLRLLSPDYADGISQPRVSYNPRYPLPNPRLIANYIHSDIPLESPYNLMKMQWGQFINHDITNTALSTYDGLVDCCKNPGIRGCWPIFVPPGDRFYSQFNVTCLNFIRSGVCPLCTLGPRQQLNKNTAFLDASHVYGNTQEQAQQVRAFHGGLLKTSLGKHGEHLLPIASLKSQEQCSGSCFVAGDSRVNQHPALAAMHTIMVRNHNYHAFKLAHRHPGWNDEYLFQEARRINIAEYQMITFNEYLPIVFGPTLTAYYKLLPLGSGQTYYNPKVDPTTWNEYSTASCRFGHSQITSIFGLYTKLVHYGQQPDPLQISFPLREWFLRPSFLSEGLLPQIVTGLLSKQSQAVDPWIAGDVRNHLYKSHKETSGGDLAATNIWRGRDHGIPGYVHYIEYCFNMKIHGWKDLSIFIPQYSLNQLRKVYKVVENIDLFTGGLAERHFPGADIGPTFACINGIQYYHLKFGDRYYFEHTGQAGSFTPDQLTEIKKTNLAKLLCRNAKITLAPAYAFLQPSNYNPIIDCSVIAEFNHSKF